MTFKTVFGFPFFDGSREEAVGLALRLIERGGASAVTPNPEIVLAAEKNAALRAAIRSADLVLPDGVGLILASKLARTPLKNRLPGIDFASALMARLAERQGSAYLLGGKPGIAARAAERLAAQYAGLVMAGFHHGYFSDTEEAEILSQLRRLRPDLLLVCLGSPRQELWIAEKLRGLPVGLAVGLGGALDVYAGEKKRAPRALRRMGLEWLYRLAAEPRRIKRMLRLPGIFRLAMADRTGRKT